jgi:hypothetical protein
MNISLTDIKKVFGKKYKVNYKQLREFGNIKHSYEILDKYENGCITFHSYVNENKQCLHIDSLHRCSDSSGTHLIKLIEKLAKNINIQYTSLWDVSRLKLGECENINIKLAHIHILATGESWYNKLGYKSPDYEAEYAHNKLFIQSDFVATLSKYYNDDEQVYNTIVELTNIIEPDAEEPEVKGTIQEVFGKLHTYMKKTNNCEHVKIIADLVKLFSQDIMYDEIVVLEKRIVQRSYSKATIRKATSTSGVTKRKTSRTYKRRTIKTV